jgi:hypothetical protein
MNSGIRTPPRDDDKVIQEGDKIDLKESGDFEKDKSVVVMAENLT